MSLTVPPRPQRADAQRNRARILESATVVFAELGDEARMEEIARRSGVGVGTVYRHFPTKDALMGELVAEQFRRFLGHAAAALEVEDPWEAFSGALRANAEIMAENIAVQDVIMRGGPAVWEHAAEARSELVRTFGKVIRRAQRAGVVRQDLEPEEIGMLMKGICSTMTADPAPSHVFSWERHLEIMLDGLRPR